jgi:hypothetical protein
VGVMPYNLHGLDCSPAKEAECPTFTTKAWPSSHGGGTRETIVLQFYGPVFDGQDGYGSADDDETIPLVILVQSIALCTPNPCWDEEENWTDRTDLFDVYVPGQTGSGSREIWVARRLYNSSPVSLAGHRYQIDPKFVSDVSCVRADVDGLGASNAHDLSFSYYLDPYCDQPSPAP